MSAGFLDLLMMASLPGRERSEKHWRDLVAGANLAVAGIHVISGSDLSLAEAVRDSAGGRT